jgi:hypothetical protein
MSSVNSPIDHSNGHSLKAEYLGKPLFTMGEQSIKIGDVITCADDLFDYVVGELAQANRYMKVEGYGVASLTKGVTAHRVYDAYGNMLQILIQGGRTLACNWFAQESWYTPTSEEELDRWCGEYGLIGDPAIEFQGEAWQRVWVTEKEGWIPGIEMVENVLIPADGSASYTLHHTAMMYGNEVLPKKAQFLLVSCVNKNGRKGVQLHRGVEFDPSQFLVRRVLH